MPGLTEGVEEDYDGAVFRDDFLREFVEEVVFVLEKVRRKKRVTIFRPCSREGGNFSRNSVALPMICLLLLMALSILEKYTFMSTFWNLNKLLKCTREFLGPLETFR